MDGSKMSQDELVEKLKHQVALENIELLLMVSSVLRFSTTVYDLIINENNLLKHTCYMNIIHDLIIKQIVQKSFKNEYLISTIYKCLYTNCSDQQYLMSLLF